MDTCVLRNVYEILRYHHWSTWSIIKVGVKKCDAHYIKLGGPFSQKKPFNLHIICHYSNSAYNARFIYLIFIILNLVSQHKRKRKVFHFFISFLRPNSLLYFILKYSQLVMGNLAHSKNSATITTLEYVVSLNKQTNKKLTTTTIHIFLMADQPIIQRKFRVTTFKRISKNNFDVRVSFFLSVYCLIIFT